MSRHNPILGNDRAFTGTYAGFDGGRVDDRQAPRDPYGGAQGYASPQYGQSAQYGQPAQGQHGQATEYGQQAPRREDLEAMYARPSATGYDTGRMTMRDALNAITATLGVIVLVAAAVMAAPIALGLALGTQGAELGYGLAMIATLVGLVGGLVLGLVNAFKKQPSAFLVLAYAVFEGLLLGGISTSFEVIYPGIVLQAVMGTLAVATTILVLFRVGVLRTSPRLTKIFMVAMLAYLGFCLVNIGMLAITGTDLRSGMLGLAIGALAVLMASYSLVMDFEDVQRGVSNGVPRVFAWRCAFGLAATLVWMYIEILRIFSIFRD